MSLKKWFEQDWVDIGAKKKVVDLLNVVDPNLKLIEKENIQNVFQRLKQPE